MNWLVKATALDYSTIEEEVRKFVNDAKGTFCSISSSDFSEITESEFNNKMIINICFDGGLVIVLVPTFKTLNNEYYFHAFDNSSVLLEN